MAEHHHRWLTLDEISGLLRLPRAAVVRLAETGCLSVIWGRKSHRTAEARFLDPTPEYAEKLRLGALLHQNLFPVPPGMSEYALFTLREVAVVCGWTYKYARNYMERHTIESIKLPRNLYLYSSATVREILWRRDNRKMARQRAPFLLTHLIEWFKKNYAEDLKDIPTDEEFLQDDVIRRKLEKIVEMKEPYASKARQDFASKVRLAQKVVQILDQPKEPSIT